MEINIDKQAYYDDIYRAAKNNDRTLFRSLFLKLHGNDQAEVFHLLYPEKKAKIIHFLTAEEFADIFDVMELEDQLSASEYLPKEYMRDVFTYVSDDNVADFLQSIDPEEADEMLGMMKKEDRQAIEELLLHEEKTAGSIMTTEYITMSIYDTASQVIKEMRKIGRRAEMIYYIFVVDEEDHLEGVLSLRDLILSPADSPLKDIMNSQVVSVNVKTDQEEVASLIQEYDLLAVPVTEDDNTLVGIVTVDDVMDVLEEEATEDFHKMAGISDMEASSEGVSVLGITKSRLPWIIILLFLGLISANLINSFEATLEKAVQLAVFMPIIMDTAGNVGTQALAVSVRRLTLESDDETFWSLFFKEFFSGVLMGIAAGIVLGIIAFVLFRNPILAMVIATSLFVTVSFSTVVGFTVPIIFTKINIDPAVASGPFITTINDTVGLFTYFSIATYLLHHIYV